MDISQSGAGDGKPHYPNTDTLWADKGNAMYSWLCAKKGYFKEHNLNAESHGDLMEVCFNFCYMHVVLGVNLPEIFKFDKSYPLGLFNGRCSIGTFT